jgi:D-3-phosphoglycerate dehydrogenase
MAIKAVRLNSYNLPVSDHERFLLKEAGIEHLVEINGDTPEQIIEVAKDADVIIIQAAKVRRDVIEQLEKCRILCRYGIGVDNIDVDTATEKGIVVTNVPDFCVSEMAEHTMALLLGMARNLLVMHNSVESGNWLEAKKTEKMLRIKGKTLGLIGFGNSSKEVAVRAKGFGLRIIDYHRHVNPEEEKQYGVEPVTLETLLRTSDFIVVLCALTPETKGLIGEKEFRMMKPDAIVINTSRGGIIDEVALAIALKERRISGAGIDCHEHLNMFMQSEGPVASPLIGLDNIILTPHIGGTSEATTEECYTKAIQDIKRVMDGRYPINLVNRSLKPWFELRD